MRTIGIVINFTSLKEGKIYNILRGIRKGLFHGYLRDFKELKLIFVEASYRIINKHYEGVTKMPYFPSLTAKYVNIILELDQENLGKEPIK